MSTCESISIRNPARKIAWSSAISIRIFDFFDMR
jgi:hypothetical protein